MKLTQLISLFLIGATIVSGAVLAPKNARAEVDIAKLTGEVEQMQSDTEALEAMTSLWDYDAPMLKVFKLTLQEGALIARLASGENALEVMIDGVKLYGELALDEIKEALLKKLPSGFGRGISIFSAAATLGEWTGQAALDVTFKEILARGYWTYKNQPDNMEIWWSGGTGPYAKAILEEMYGPLSAAIFKGAGTHPKIKEYGGLGFWEGKFRAMADLEQQAKNIKTGEIPQEEKQLKKAVFTAYFNKKYPGSNAELLAELAVNNTNQSEIEQALSGGNNIKTAPASKEEEKRIADLKKELENLLREKESLFNNLKNEYNKYTPQAESIFQRFFYWMPGVGPTKSVEYQDRDLIDERPKRPDKYLNNQKKTNSRGKANLEKYRQYFDSFTQLSDAQIKQIRQGVETLYALGGPEYAKDIITRYNALKNRVNSDFLNKIKEKMSGAGEEWWLSENNIARAEYEYDTASQKHDIFQEMKQAGADQEIQELTEKFTVLEERRWLLIGPKKLAPGDLDAQYGDGAPSAVRSGDKILNAKYDTFYSNENRYSDDSLKNQSEGELDYAIENGEETIADIKKALEEEAPGVSVLAKYKNKLKEKKKKSQELSEKFSKLTGDKTVSLGQNSFDVLEKMISQREEFFDRYKETQKMMAEDLAKYEKALKTAQGYKKQKEDYRKSAPQRAAEEERLRKETQEKAKIKREAEEKTRGAGEVQKAEQELAQSRPTDQDSQNAEFRKIAESVYLTLKKVSAKQISLSKREIQLEFNKFNRAHKKISYGGLDSYNSDLFNKIGPLYMDVLGCAGWKDTDSCLGKEKLPEFKWVTIQGRNWDEISGKLTFSSSDLKNGTVEIIARSGAGFGNWYDGSKPLGETKVEINIGSGWQQFEDRNQNNDRIFRFTPRSGEQTIQIRVINPGDDLKYNVYSDPLNWPAITIVYSPGTAAPPSSVQAPQVSKPNLLSGTASLTDEYETGQAFNFRSGSKVSFWDGNEFSFYWNSDGLWADSGDGSGGVIDLGEKKIDAINSVPTSGFSRYPDIIKPKTGHSYGLLLKNGKYAVIEVITVTDIIEFKWKYQPDGSASF